MQIEKFQNYLLIMIALTFNACQFDKSPQTTIGEFQSTTLKFNKELWNTKIEGAYPHRINLIDDILYTDTIRRQNKTQAIEILGLPDYQKENHLYYNISKSKLGFWTLKTKTLVIKIKENDGIEWIKMHG